MPWGRCIGVVILALAAALVAASAGTAAGAATTEGFQEPRWRFIALGTESSFYPCSSSFPAECGPGVSTDAAERAREWCRFPRRGDRLPSGGYERAASNGVGIEYDRVVSFQIRPAGDGERWIRDPGTVAQQRGAGPPAMVLSQIVCGTAEDANEIRTTMRVAGRRFFTPSGPSKLPQLSRIEVRGTIGQSSRLQLPRARNRDWQHVAPGLHRAAQLPGQPDGHQRSAFRLPPQPAKSLY